MPNAIYLDKLKKDSKDKILWKENDGATVKFDYRGVSDEFTIIHNVDADHVLVNYKGEEFNLPKISITRCCLGKLFGFSVYGNYKYNEGDIIDRNYGTLKILSRTKSNNGRIKAYDVECIECGNTLYKIQEANLVRGDGCSYCSNHKVVVGKTDLWTVRPDVAAMLTNPDDGYKVSEFSNKKKDFTCNICGEHVGLKQIYIVCKDGLSCPSCGDGISYPNKFMYHFLKALHVDFETEKTFDWCKFLLPNGDITTGRYDFFIKNEKCILEMDSSLGHGHIIHSRSKMSVNETIFRDEKKTELAINNGYKIIRIDCRYSGHGNRFYACKQGIENSELAKMFDLSCIDWDEINTKSQQSFVVKTCQMYNDGMSSGEIAKRLNKAQCTIIDYLHLGDKANLCTFNKQKF